MKGAELEHCAGSPILLGLSGPNKSSGTCLLFSSEVSFFGSLVIHRHERVSDINKLILATCVASFCWVFPFLIWAFRGFMVWSGPVGNPGQSLPKSKGTGSSGKSPISRGHSSVWFPTWTLATGTSWALCTQESKWLPHLCTAQGWTDRLG